MNPTSAHTAPLSPTTQRTSGTDTATTAASTTSQTIACFIKQQLNEARKGESSGAFDSSARVAQLGFVNAANVRYSKFLDLFRSSPRLTERYRESYPNSLFLPWAAFHEVLRILDLWVELPEHYRGAVPAEQLPWMEIFELDPADCIMPEDAGGLLGTLAGRGVSSVEAILTGAAIMHRVNDTDGSSLEFTQEVRRLGHLTSGVGDVLCGMKNYPDIRDRLLGAWRAAEDSFFVVAPPEAFDTKEDWLARLRDLAADASTQNTVAPDDPLVIRFCRGGVLVVAAWGEEASTLNEMVNSLGL